MGGRLVLQIILISFSKEMRIKIEIQKLIALMWKRDEMTTLLMK